MHLEARIDAQVYMAHIFRGARITHLLVKGIATEMGQVRKRCASKRALDHFKLRLVGTKIGSVYLLGKI